VNEPRRHDRSRRSARKALRQSGRIQEELEYLAARLRRLLGHVEYAARKADKLRNRLKDTDPARPKGR
jgi:uncharacterized membrane protein